MGNHNGWSSWETWCAVVWGFSGDDTDGSYFRDIMTDKSLDRGEKVDAVSAQLSDNFNQYVEDITPRDVTSSILGDFIANASNRIDWDEIAEAWYTDNAELYAEDDADEDAAADEV